LNGFDLAGSNFGAYSHKDEKRAADVVRDAVEVMPAATGEETESAGQRGASRL
jgi:hypothetical protein